MFCECSDILVRHGRAVVLDVKRLEIPSGRITAVIGPNGAGKTTLLEVIALLRRPTSGRVSLWGQPARNGHGKLRREVVLVMHPGYMFRGSVWDNVMYGLKARGVGHTEARDRAAEALRMVDLSEFGGRETRGLSAGERQRVNLARAIALHPPAVLLDEPAANVDERTIEIIRGLLRGLRDQHGTTIVHTCPTESMFHAITDQVVHLEAGQVRGVHGGHAAGRGESPAASPS